MGSKVKVTDICLAPYVMIQKHFIQNILTYSALIIKIFSYVCHISGNKPKWLPYEIELPKTRRRPAAGRPRAGSQERSRATPESARDGPRDTRESARRREGRGGGGSGRDSSERTTASARRNRREQGDKPAASSEDREPADSNKSASVETPRSDRGLCSFLFIC